MPRSLNVDELKEMSYDVPFFRITLSGLISPGPKLRLYLLHLCSIYCAPTHSSAPSHSSSAQMSRPTHYHTRTT